MPSLPPVGELRFEAPKPYEKKFSQGKIDATVSVPTCIQFSDDFTYPVSMLNWVDVYVYLHKLIDLSIPDFASLFLIA
jgi:hypothetical protein